MQNRHPALWVGGDQIQLEATQTALRVLGVDVQFSYEPEPDLAEYDVVHLFNLPTAWTYLQSVNAQRQQKPIVISAIYQETEWFAPYSIHQKTLDYTTKVICLSAGEVERMERHLTCDEHKVTIVPNGVDPLFAKEDVEPYRLPDGREYVLCVGRIHDDKNQLLLARACRSLDLPLILVGEESDPRYAAEIRHLKNLNCVYLGVKSKSELLPIYKGAKVLACVSKAEAYPMVVLEAALSGCNIVLTSGSAAMKDWPNIELCDPSDLASISSAVAKQMTRPRSCTLVQHVAQYTWEWVAKEVKAVYDEALAMPFLQHIPEIGTARITADLNAFPHAQKERALEQTCLFPAWTDFYLGNTVAACRSLETFERIGGERGYIAELFIRSVADYALDPYLKHQSYEAGRQFLRCVFSHLPPALADLSGMEFAALGRFNALAAFKLFAMQPQPMVTVHALRAVRYDRRWLSNGGLRSIAFQSLAGARGRNLYRSTKQRVHQIMKTQGSAK